MRRMQPTKKAGAALKAHCQTSAFAQILNRFDGSPVLLHKAMQKEVLQGAEAAPPQRISLWRDRGWASPMHFYELQALLPEGLTIKDLFMDRLLADRALAEDAKAAEQAQEEAAQ